VEKATAQGPRRRLPRLWDRRLGKYRQTGDCQGHRRRPLARIRQGGRSRLLRRGREELGEAAARTTTPLLRSTRPHTTPRRRCATCPTLVELQREGGCIDPGTRNADRHAAVELGAGEQASRYWRIITTVRPKLRQRRSDLHTRW